MENREQRTGKPRGSLSVLCSPFSVLCSLVRDLPQIADEQQVLEVRRDRREVLERLDGLLAALGIARAPRRGADLVREGRLAVGGGPGGAQVAPGHAVACKLGDGADDLALGVVVVAVAAADLSLDDAELLELLD